MELKKLFFKEHPNPMLIYDKDSLEIVDVNQSFIDIYGYSRSEIQALTIKEIRPEQDIPVLKEKLQEIDQGAHSYDRGTVRHRTKEGEILHVRIASQYYPIDERNTRVVHINDLTDVINLKNKYKDTLNELNHHIDENPLAMVKFDSEFEITEWSKRAMQKLGYQKSEVLGKTIFELGLVAKEDDSINNKFREIIEGTIGKTRFNTIALQKDGGQVHVTLHVSALRTSDNQLKSVVAFIENITEQKRLELLFKTTEDMAKIGGWEYTPETEELFWTDQVYRMHELPIGEKVDIEKALGFYNPEDRDDLEKKIESAMSYNKAFDEEYKLITSNGNRKWVRTMGQPIIQNGEFFKLMGTFQDITNQKLKERQIEQKAKEKEVLLAEVHHRVKNNLAIISGLLELKAMNLENNEMADVLRQSQSRIQSMAMIHEVLYEAEDFSNLEFVEFIQNLVEAIEGFQTIGDKNINSRLHCDESLRLNVNQAIPCGLLMNELITNSFKHAFTDQQEGTIEITVDFDSEQNEVVLKVQDDGKGFPKNFLGGELNTLGVTLINQLTKQLSGSINMKNNNGAHIELRFEKSDKSGSSSQHFRFS